MVTVAPQRGRQSEDDAAFDLRFDDARVDHLAAVHDACDLVHRELAAGDRNLGDLRHMRGVPLHECARPEMAACAAAGPIRRARAAICSTRVCRGFALSRLRRKSTGLLPAAAASSSMKLSITKQLGAWLTERM
jgi:hypothetical protein